MALQKEIWIKDIQEQLFANNGFVKMSTDHSAWIDNLYVHIPQAGNAQAVTKNRASLPATIAQRTDSDFTYRLNEYSLAPTLLTNIDELQVSYPKRQSILKQQVDALGDCIGNTVLYGWAPTGSTRIIRTTGANVNTALASGATGSRSAVTISDIARLKSILDNDNVPQMGRKLLMNADMYNTQLMLIDSVASAEKYGSANLPSGVVNRILGFDIVIRPSVLQYSSGGTLQSISDSGLPTITYTTDNIGCLAWHPDFVSTALGDTKVFFDEDKPEYYGSVFSALQMLGASRLRSDYKGIAALVQQ